MCAGDPDVRTMMREIEARMRDFPVGQEQAGARPVAGLMARIATWLAGFGQGNVKHG